MKKLLAIGLAAMMVAGTLASSAFALEIKTDAEVAAEESGAGGGEKAVGKDAYGEDIRIAFLPNVIGDSCAFAWAAGMQKYLDNFSNVTFDVYDGKASVDTEVQIMDELIEQQYDAIILQATDAAGLAAATDKAEAAGIPVINCNLDAATTHTCLVAAVDVEAGQLMARQIGDSLPDGGKVVIISATPGASKGENIDTGFKGVMEEEYPDIEIIDEQTGEWLTENANTVMNDFLTKYDHIDAVLCHNDAMAEGAAEAVKAAGRLDEMQIWGCDGESKMLDYIEEGLCTGTVYTNADLQGQACAQFAMYAIGSGITAANLESTPIVKIAPIVVTADNVGDITEDMRW